VVVACSHQCHPYDAWLCRTVRNGVVVMSDHELQHAAYWTGAAERRDCFGHVIRAEMAKRGIPPLSERPPTYERR
jgi:hypothetical protein